MLILRLHRSLEDGESALIEAPAYDVRRFYLSIQVVLLVLGTRDSGLDTSTSLGEFPLAERRRGISYR